MAKTSKIQQNLKRHRLAAKYASRRAELKAVVADPNKTPEQKIEAQIALSRLPRNSSRTRLRNRCSLTGRPRGHLRKFGICRNKFRDLAHRGEIPGVRKSSW